MVPFFSGSVFAKDLLHIFMVQYIHLISISLPGLRELFRILLPCCFNDRFDNHFALLRSMLKGVFFASAPHTNGQRGFTTESANCGLCVHSGLREAWEIEMFECFS